MNQMQALLNQMFGSNPLFQRAMEMSRGKTQEEVLQVAKNLCRQRGINFDEAYQQFQMQMKQMSGMFEQQGISR